MRRRNVPAHPEEPTSSSTLEFVKEIDAFPKIPEGYKETSAASGGSKSDVKQSLFKEIEMKLIELEQHKTFLQEKGQKAVVCDSKCFSYWLERLLTYV